MGSPFPLFSWYLGRYKIIQKILFSVFLLSSVCILRTWTFFIATVRFFSGNFCRSSFLINLNSMFASTLWQLVAFLSSSLEIPASILGVRLEFLTFKNPIFRILFIAFVVYHSLRERSNLKINFFLFILGFVMFISVSDVAVCTFKYDVHSVLFKKLFVRVLILQRFIY